MNILLIHQYFLEKNDGGGSRFNEMSRIWAEEGHHITVIAGMVHYSTGKKPKKYKGKFIYRDNAYFNNVNVIRTHVSEAYNKNFLGRLWGYLSYLISSIWAGIFFSEKKYDIIIATSPPLFVGITAFILSRVKRCPYVFEVRDLWPESAIDTGILRNKYVIKLAYKIEKFVYKHSVLVNTLTPAFKNIIIKKKKIPGKKVIMFPNGADLSFSEKILSNPEINKLRSKLSLDNKFTIIYIGAHGIANHLIQLVDAAELLQNTEVTFLLIGDGMEKKKLIREAKSRRISNIKFIDPVPKRDVFNYIMASDVGISVLKKNETFKTIYSNKTFDYMACKKPVIMVIDGVSRELIEKAKCGVFVEPENSILLAKKIQSLTNKREELAEMGENGYRYVKTHFDRNVIARKYINTIQDITDNL